MSNAFGIPSVLDCHDFFLYNLPKSISKGCKNRLFLVLLATSSMALTGCGDINNSGSGAPDTNLPGIDLTEGAAEIAKKRQRLEALQKELELIEKKIGELAEKTNENLSLYDKDSKEYLDEHETYRHAYSPLRKEKIGIVSQIEEIQQDINTYVMGNTYFDGGI